MRVSVKVALLVSALAGMATVGEYSLLSAAHASTGPQHASEGAEVLHTHTAKPENTARQKLRHPAVVKDSDDYDSYVEVFQEIDEDPEHAQAKMITPSYDINN